MTKQEWKNSTSALRKLIREAFRDNDRGRDIDRRCEYKFALVFNSRFRYFHLYNGSTKNTIATVKLSGNKAYVRYRKNSWYANIIEKIELPNRKMIFVESRNLGRNSEWVRERIGNRVERSMTAFLAEQTALRQLRSRRDTQDTSGSLIRITDITLHRALTSRSSMVHLALSSGARLQVRLPSDVQSPLSETQLVHRLVEMINFFIEHDMMDLPDDFAYDWLEQMYEYERRQTVRPRERWDLATMTDDDFREYEPTNYYGASIVRSQPIPTEAMYMGSPVVIDEAVDATIQEQMNTYAQMRQEALERAMSPRPMVVSQEMYDYLQGEANITSNHEPDLPF